MFRIIHTLYMLFSILSLWNPVHVYFTCTTHLLSDWPHGECVRATCGWRLPCWSDCDPIMCKSPRTTVPVCVLCSPRMNLSPPPVSAQMLPPPETLFGVSITTLTRCVVTTGVYICICCSSQCARSYVRSRKQGLLSLNIQCLMNICGIVNKTLSAMV